MSVLLVVALVTSPLTVGGAASAAVPPGTVVGWGNDDFGQATPPAGLTGAVAVAAGANHSLALKADGTVVGWGANDYGQATPPPGLTGVDAVAAGGTHSLALKSDGTVVGWGDNFVGQASPPPGLTGVTAIAAGFGHSLALKSDGTVVGWGYDGDGQASPPPGLTGVTAIAAGGYHSLALKSDGTVVGWGLNGDGQLTPPPGLTGVTAIAAGFAHSLALKADGTVVGWGFNGKGQTTTPPGLTGVTAIAAGYGQSLALKSNGTVVGWGDDSNGQATPPPGLTGVTAIAAGIYHSLALKSPIPQTITFTSTPPATATVGESYVVSATGGGSGKPVVFSIDGSSTAGACTVSASTPDPGGGYQATVSFTGPGSCVVAADQDGNDEYAAAERVTQSVTVDPAPVVPSVDRTVSADRIRAGSSVTSPRLSTSGAGELVVAYVQVDGPQSPTQQVKKVTGGGLTWRLAARSNATWGSSEVWYAYASGSFNAAVKASYQGSYDSSITVTAYKDAATAPAAVGTGSGIGSRAVATVTATKSGSLVVASAHNWTVDATPTPDPGQSLAHLFLDRRVKDTFWVQATSRTTTPGPVTVGAGIPAGSRWTVAAVEIAGR